MAKRQIFYSFHYDNDVFRVQQIRNMGALEENKPVSINEWETVKRGGSKAIEQWIDNNMKYRSCVVVLIGSETAKRPWVQYEIQKAWRDGKGLLGVHIHNLNCPNTGTCYKGTDPFAQSNFQDSFGRTKYIKCNDPTPSDAYNSIRKNLEGWIEEALIQRT